MTHDGPHEAARAPRRTIVTYQGEQIPLDELPPDAGPDLDGGLELTQREWDAFWKALHE